MVACLFAPASSRAQKAYITDESSSTVSVIAMLVTVLRHPADAGEIALLPLLQAVFMPERGRGGFRPQSGMTSARCDESCYEISGMTRFFAIIHY
jgi:hypothetical protein